jgi:hypothetical protein
MTSFLMKRKHTAKDSILPFLNGDVSVSFRINKKRVSHEFSLKILNVGMRTGMHFYQYNEKTFEIEEKEGTGLIPNISYKIYF